MGLKMQVGLEADRGTEVVSVLVSSEAPGKTRIKIGAGHARSPEVEIVVDRADLENAMRVAEDNTTHDAPKPARLAPEKPAKAAPAAKTPGVDPSK